VPEVVGNGVDPTLYRPGPDAQDAQVRARWGLGAGPVVLSVGGFEARKNTLGIIEAFARLREAHPAAQLVVAGGASLLDHAAYRARCQAALAAHGLALGPGGPVIETGALPQTDMPALYRVADLLAFPSWTEGFGLCVLEAMACGTPVVVSRGAPFTEYLRADEALFVDPADPAAIAAAMTAALVPGTRQALQRAGFAVSKAQTWRACAERHRAAYAACARTEPESIHA
jgi:glycosyltransferase involved in cell wall biosynthesis